MRIRNSLKLSFLKNGYSYEEKLTFNAKCMMLTSIIGGEDSGILVHTMIPDVTTSIDDHFRSLKTCYRKNRQGISKDHEQSRQQSVMSRFKKLSIVIRKEDGTTWMLKSAIDNPDVVIVSKDAASMAHLKRQYNWLLSKSPWYKRLRWALYDRIHPTFITLVSGFGETSKPIVFHNESLTK